jgi:hypothetical protein
MESNSSKNRIHGAAAAAFEKISRTCSESKGIASSQYALNFYKEETQAYSNTGTYYGLKFTSGSLNHTIKCRPPSKCIIEFN